VGYFSQETLDELTKGIAELPPALRKLKAAGRAFANDQAREHAQHGLCRRLSTMVHMVQTVFELLPRERDRDGCRPLRVLTTEANAEVRAIHPKAMPVILMTPDEVETWMTAPPDEALKLQRPLPDGAVRIVARGVKEDPLGPMA